MFNTKTTVIIAAISSTVSSAVIGALCYVKGKRDGQIQALQAPATTAQSSTSSEQHRAHA